MKRLLLFATMLALVLVFAVSALGQVSGDIGGNGNIIVCANVAAQNAQGEVDAGRDAETTLTNLLAQLARCGVYDITLNDQHTTFNGDPTIIQDPAISEDTTIDDQDTAQGSDQETESGSIDTAADVNNWGDNAALCAPIMQSSYTGNDQTGQQFALSDTTTDSIEPSGNMSGLSSELSGECAPAVDQSTGS